MLFVCRLPLRRSFTVHPVKVSGAAAAVRSDSWETWFICRLSSYNIENVLNTLSYLCAHCDIAVTCHRCLSNKLNCCQQTSPIRLCISFNNTINIVIAFAGLPTALRRRSRNIIFRPLLRHKRIRRYRKCTRTRFTLYSILVWCIVQPVVERSV